jgi:redox-sensing transcriptional repressor
MINKKCILRLLRYKNALHRFDGLGFVKIFSDNLADAVGVTASQVRKDFSLFGISGNKRGGYQIDALLEKLNGLMGKNETQKVVIVGGGHIGTALMKYKGFEKEGIKIVACFDIDPAKFSGVKGHEIPVLPVGQLKVAPIRLKATSDCVINNVNLVLELETLIYFIINGLGKGFSEIHEAGLS